jgi:hypothetical protein
VEQYASLQPSELFQLSHTRCPERQRLKLPLFDNLRIVEEVERAARIAVDVVSSLSCSKCMHIVVSDCSAATN